VHLHFCWRKRLHQPHSTESAIGAPTATGQSQSKSRLSQQSLGTNEILRIRTLLWSNWLDTHAGDACFRSALFSDCKVLQSFARDCGLYRGGGGAVAPFMRPTAGRRLTTTRMHRFLLSDKQKLIHNCQHASSYRTCLSCDAFYPHAS
jgi:hypothetical protein